MVTSSLRHTNRHTFPIFPGQSGYPLPRSCDYFLQLRHILVFRMATAALRDGCKSLEASFLAFCVGLSIPKCVCMVAGSLQRRLAPFSYVGHT